MNLRFCQISEEIITSLLYAIRFTCSGVLKIGLYIFKNLYAQMFSFHVADLSRGSSSIRFCKFQREISKHKFLASVSMLTVSNLGNNFT
jgi:hypothetical protein